MNEIDQFLVALTNNDAQTAGIILEQKAAAGGMPPSLVDTAGRAVGLVRTNGAWIFQPQGAAPIPTVTQTGGNGTQQLPTQAPTNPPIRPPKPSIGGIK